MTGAPFSVLVVDDEPPIRKLLRLGLAAHGYQVLEAPIRFNGIAFHTRGPLALRLACTGFTRHTAEI
jgi:CheY-like chemotaxis protein